ncbi:MAG: RecQ family ATP-dependent DNA helicase [Prevotellaceae bacterium]|jgi:ATP-dependent DNA helicase RecQ|nr:RecQ family ATP-dependent DNA helicase [Prevotellaceae bacterium]
MTDDFQKILQQYWGYSHFRALQEDIIREAYEGRDVLALMPTGGGKSITFQVPALAREGICLVVTPLIALMKDQVENLKKRGIKALAIYSGMSNREIDIAFDNAVYGPYKFLYLSPERLGTELFQVRVQKMNVNLLAVDEAHCISQWGYDFRPSYLEIAHARKWLPGVPVLALTATATPEVAQDIMNKLGFRRPNLWQKSFERKNLIYVVRETEDKHSQLLHICRRVPGTGIVYVRSRGNTQDIAGFLNENRISADFYHAGLGAGTRHAKQDDWKQGRTRVMVCTNAFGMGIDKPDVRFVIHADLPDSVEAYFQEAGRAGRDEKTAYAVLLYDNADNQKAAQRLRTAFPPAATIREVYQKIYMYFNIPYGAGKGSVFNFNLMDFSVKNNIHSLTAYNALRCLQREGYLELTDELDNPTRIHFAVTRDELYKVQINDESLDRFIRTLLRAYTGVFTGFVPVDEHCLAKWMKVEPAVINDYLLRLSRMQVIDYIPKKRSPLLLFHEERLDADNLRLSKEHYGDLKKRYEQRTNALLHYAAGTAQCRSRQLLAYFGETNAAPCGRCDVCTGQHEAGVGNYKFTVLSEKLKTLIRANAFTPARCIDSLAAPPGDAIKVLRWLIDHDEVSETDDGILEWKAER